MSLLDFTGIGPYIRVIEIGAMVALVVAAAAWLEHDGAERVQRKWDAANAQAVFERDKRLFRDSENNSARDTALQKRVADSSRLDVDIIERMTHVPQDTACRQLPRDLGVLLNAAAAGTPLDTPAAGQPDGTGEAAAALQPRATQ